MTFPPHSATFQHMSKPSLKKEKFTSEVHVRLKESTRRELQIMAEKLNMDPSDLVRMGIGLILKKKTIRVGV